MIKELKIIYNDMIKPAGRFAYNIASGFFAIPTAIRRVSDKALPTENDCRISGSLFGGMYNVMVSSVIVPTLYYNDRINGTTALLLLTPLATNLASGAYEIWRYARNEAKSPASIIPTSTIPASPSGLETKVEETEINIKKPQIKPQPSKYEIPNPWNIEIEEIEDVRLIKRTDVERHYKNPDDYLNPVINEFSDSDFVKTELWKRAQSQKFEPAPHGTMMDNIFFLNNQYK